MVVTDHGGRQGLTRILAEQRRTGAPLADALRTVLLPQRERATGVVSLRCEGGDRLLELHVRKGKLVDAAGKSLETLSPRWCREPGLTLTGDLATLVGVGMDYQAAIDRSWSQLVRELVHHVREESEAEWHEGAELSTSAFPLPGSTFALVSQALEQARSPQRAAWDFQDLMGRMVLRTDLRELEGLDIISTRTLQLVDEVRSLEDLITRSGRSQLERSMWAWRAFDLLFHTGLIRLTGRIKLAQDPPLELPDDVVIPGTPMPPPATPPWGMPRIFQEQTEDTDRHELEAAGLPAEEPSAFAMPPDEDPSAFAMPADEEGFDDRDEDSSVYEVPPLDEELLTEDFSKHFEPVEEEGEDDEDDGLDDSDVGAFAMPPDEDSQVWEAPAAEDAASGLDDSDLDAFAMPPDEDSDVWEPPSPEALAGEPALGDSGLDGAGLEDSGLDDSGLDDAFAMPADEEEILGEAESEDAAAEAEFAPFARPADATPLPRAGVADLELAVEELTEELDLVVGEEESGAVVATAAPEPEEPVGAEDFEVAAPLDEDEPTLPGTGRRIERPAARRRRSDEVDLMSLHDPDEVTDEDEPSVGGGPAGLAAFLEDTRGDDVEWLEATEDHAEIAGEWTDKDGTASRLPMTALERLTALAERLEEANPIAALGLPRDALPTEDDIADAYDRQILEFHEDRWQAAGDEALALAKRCRRRLRRAMRDLGEPEDIAARFLALKAEAPPFDPYDVG